MKAVTHPDPSIGFTLKNTSPGSTVVAVAYRSGHIDFLDRTHLPAPEGTLFICRGPAKKVIEAVSGLARRSYSGTTLYVPGCPEAATDQDALESFKSFFNHVNEALRRPSRMQEPT